MRLIKPIVIISFPPLLFLLVLLFFAFNLNFYQQQYDKISAMQNISKIDAVAQAGGVYNYVNGKSAKLAGTYDSRELTHLADIRNIIFYVKLATLILAVFSIIAFLWLYFKKGIIGVAAALLWSNIISLIACLVLIGSFALNFDGLFFLFHQVMFRNDFWQLDPTTEMLINIFPPQFFGALITRIIIITVLINLILAIFTWVILAKYRLRKAG